jgi:hypothetical protein
LRTVIQQAVRRALGEMGVEDYEFTDDCFSPGRPNPTYRMKASS